MVRNSKYRRNVVQDRELLQTGIGKIFPNSPLAAKPPVKDTSIEDVEVAEPRKAEPNNPYIPTTPEEVKAERDAAVAGYSYRKQTGSLDPQTEKSLPSPSTPMIEQPQQVTQQQTDLANTIGQIDQQPQLTEAQKEEIKNTLRADPSKLGEIKAGLTGVGALAGVGAAGTIYSGQTLSYVGTGINPTGAAIAGVAIGGAIITGMLNREAQLKSNAAYQTKQGYEDYTLALKDIKLAINGLKEGRLTPDEATKIYNDAITGIIVAEKKMKYQNTISPDAWNKNKPKMQQINRFLTTEKKSSDMAMQQLILGNPNVEWSIPVYDNTDDKQNAE